MGVGDLRFVRWIFPLRGRPSISNTRPVTESPEEIELPRVRSPPLLVGEHPSLVLDRAPQALSSLWRRYSGALSADGAGDGPHLVDGCV